MEITIKQTHPDQLCGLIDDCGTWEDTETFNLPPSDSVGSYYQFCTQYKSCWFNDLTDMAAEEFDRLYYAGQREFHLEKYGVKTYVKLDENIFHY